VCPAYGTGNSTSGPSKTEAPLIRHENWKRPLEEMIGTQARTRVPGALSGGYGSIGCRHRELSVKGEFEP